MRKKLYLIGITSYPSVGILISQLLNVIVYNSNKLKTWFNWLGLTEWQPTKSLVLVECVVMFLFGIYFGLLILEKITKKADNETTINLVIYCLSLLVISQLVFSSIIRFIYELSYLLIFLTHIIMYHIFTNSIKYNNINKVSKYLYKELWELFRVFLSLSFGLPIIIGGGVLISVFFKNNLHLMRCQLYRHICMILYLEFGLLSMILIPIFMQIVKVRKIFYNNIYKNKCS